MLRPQQNYVYVLSRYLNSLVCTVVLVCLTIVLLVVGTTTCIFAFLLYLMHTTPSFSVYNLGQSVCERSSTERRKKTSEEVEEALLAIHVASNGSQESTDPNCSFRLQDPRGIQGLKGRFRVRTRFAGSARARPASATTTTMRASFAWAEMTMTR